MYLTKDNLLKIKANLKRMDDVIGGVIFGYNIDDISDLIRYGVYDLDFKDIQRSDDVGWSLSKILDILSGEFDEHMRIARFSSAHNSYIFKYNRNGNCTSIDDESGNASKSVYDIHNNIVYNWSSNRGRTNWIYDKPGHLMYKQIIFNDCVTTYNPDGLAICREESVDDYPKTTKSLFRKDNIVGYVVILFQKCGKKYKSYAKHNLDGLLYEEREYDDFGNVVRTRKLDKFPTTKPIEYIPRPETIISYNNTDLPDGVLLQILADGEFVGELKLVSEAMDTHPVQSIETKIELVNEKGQTWKDKIGRWWSQRS